MNNEEGKRETESVCQKKKQKEKTKKKKRKLCLSLPLGHFYLVVTTVLKRNCLPNKSKSFEIE